MFPCLLWNSAGSFSLTPELKSTIRLVMAYFLCVLGMVFVVEALPYIACPHRVKRLARQMETMPEKILQIVGLVAAGTGLLIIYLGRYLGGI